MSIKQQIIYMQVRLMRLTSEMWNKPVEMIADVFSRYGVFRYIEECFELFHVEGDGAVYEEIMSYLTNKEVSNNVGNNK